MVSLLSGIEKQQQVKQQSLRQTTRLPEKRWQVARKTLRQPS
jgi:hypothetical protein